MRRILSVLGLAARGTLPWLTLIAGVCAAAQGMSCAVALRLQPAQGLEAMLRAGHVARIASLGFAALCAVLMFWGRETAGSRLGWTLRRLRVSERAVTAIWAAHHTACFLILWAGQAAALLGLCALYPALGGTLDSGTMAVFLAMYRDGFAHALLPLGEGTLWARNASLALCLGVTAACGAFWQRRGKRGMLFAALAALTAILFPLGRGNRSAHIAVMLIALATAGAALWRMWRAGDADEQEDET